jgi:hypothetical protein
MYNTFEKLMLIFNQIYILVFTPPPECCLIEY